MGTYVFMCVHMYRLISEIKIENYCVQFIECSVLWVVFVVVFILMCFYGAGQVVVRSVQ